jgi:hypothetical protein
MILKFLSKYILEVIPSILATVVGAYIVTHYINAKPDADKAKVEAAAPATTAPSSAAPVRAAGQDSRKESAKAALVPDDKQVADKPVVEKTALEKSSDSPAAVRQPVMKDFLKRKTVVKASPEPAPAQTAVAPSDDRDANDLARAAIERLRNADQAKDKEAVKPADAPRIQEAVRAPEPVRAPDQAHPSQDRARVNATYAPAPAAPMAPAPVQLPPAQAAAAVPALPPATVIAPAQSFPQPPSHVVRADDPSRPVPPADIPSRPVDLRASAATLDTSSVADDVVAAAKTVFKSVIPDTR